MRERDGHGCGVQIVNTSDSALLGEWDKQVTSLTFNPKPPPTPKP